MKYSDGCSYPGKDLWASRCGILHFLVAISKKVMDKKARQVAYGWGDKRIEEVVSKKDKNSVCITIELLVNALEKGIHKCLTELYLNEQKAQIVDKRLEKLLKYFKYEKN